MTGTNTVALAGVGLTPGGVTDPNWVTTVTATSVAVNKAVTLSLPQQMSPGLTVSGGVIPINDTIASVTTSTSFTLKTAPSTAGSNASLSVTGYGMGGLGGLTSGAAGISGKVFICY